MYGNLHERTTILVVDDNQRIVDDYGRALSSKRASSALTNLRREVLGASSAAAEPKRVFEIISATNCADALLRLKPLLVRGTPPTVAFVDMHLSSGPNGFETIEELWRRLPELHVVLSVDQSDSVPDESSARYGQSDRFLVLKKPFDASEVRQLATMLSTKALLEQQAKRQRKDLLALSEQLRLLVDNASDFLYHRDSQNRMVYVSPGFFRMTGLNPEQWDLLYPSVIADSRQLYPEQLNPIVQLTDAEGRRRSFELDERVLVGEGGEQVVGVARDVTKQRVLENELRRAQKLEAIGRFSGGLAHDFNNMLTVISGHAELLRQEVPSEDVENILSATRQAADLTRRLLMFSRDAPAAAELVDVNQLISESSRMFGRLIPDNVHLELHLADVGRVLVAPSELARVLMNLVVNATDAMPKGGTLRIETAMTEKGDPRANKGPGVVISVSDTGEGMTAEVTERIFDPFFTTKGVGNGTGLGLSVVMGIVQQAGGSIRVASQPGEGSMFELYLPLSKNDTITPATDLGHAPEGKGERVLVVDDNLSVAELTARVLRRAGYRVHVAASSTQALELLLCAQPAFRLLVTDVIMPDMSGVELQVRVASVRPGLGVLFMSGYAAQALSEVKNDWEHAVFVAKPWSPVDLLKSARIAIERATNHGELAVSAG